MVRGVTLWITLTMGILGQVSQIKTIMRESLCIFVYFARLRQPQENSDLYSRCKC